MSLNDCGAFCYHGGDYLYYSCYHNDGYDYGYDRGGHGLKNRKCHHQNHQQDHSYNHQHVRHHSSSGMSLEYRGGKNGAGCDYDGDHPLFCLSFSNPICGDVMKNHPKRFLLMHYD